MTPGPWSGRVPGQEEGTGPACSRPGRDDHMGAQPALEARGGAIASRCVPQSLPFPHNGCVSLE